MSLMLILAPNGHRRSMRLVKLRPCHALFAHFSRLYHGPRLTNRGRADRIEGEECDAAVGSTGAKTHKGLLTLTGMVAILMLPVVAVATVGHQPAHAQEDNPPTLGAYRLGRRCLRRCNSGAARRYCCLHGFLSCLWPKAAPGWLIGSLNSPADMRRFSPGGLPKSDHIAFSVASEVIQLWYFNLGIPSKRYYSKV